MSNIHTFGNLEGDYRGNDEGAIFKEIIPKDFPSIRNFFKKE